MTARTATKPATKSVSLDGVFDEFKALLVQHASSFTVREGYVKNKRHYHLILQKPVVIDGRKRDELWFASIIQQKDSVGFYLTCVYPDVKAKLSPGLLKHLDGKCCFHMKAESATASCRHVEKSLL